MNVNSMTRVDKNIRRVNIICYDYIAFDSSSFMVYVWFASFMDPDTLINKGISLNPSD